MLGCKSSRATLTLGDGSGRLGVETNDQGEHWNKNSTTSDSSNTTQCCTKESYYCSCYDFPTEFHLLFNALIIYQNEDIPMVSEGRKLRLSSRELKTHRPNMLIRRFPTLPEEMNRSKQKSLSYFFLKIFCLFISQVSLCRNNTAHHD